MTVESSHFCWSVFSPQWEPAQENLRAYSHQHSCACTWELWQIVVRKWCFDMFCSTWPSRQGSFFPCFENIRIVWKGKLLEGKAFGRGPCPCLNKELLVDSKHCGNVEIFGQAPWPRRINIVWLVATRRGALYQCFSRNLLFCCFLGGLLSHFWNDPTVCCHLRGNVYQHLINIQN